MGAKRIALRRFAGAKLYICIKRGHWQITVLSELNNVISEITLSYLYQLSMHKQARESCEDGLQISRIEA